MGIDDLARSLRSDEPGQQVSAANALKHMVEMGMNISLALPALHEALADLSLEVRLGAVDALTAIWRRPAASQLGYYAAAIDGLRAAAPKDRISAARWLADITQPDMVRDRDERDISFAVPALAATIFDENEEVAIAALGALACAAADRQGIDQAIPAIMIAIDRCPDPVRVKAALTLRAAVEEGLDIEPYLPILRACLASKNQQLKWAATDVLGVYHVNKAQWNEIVALLTHPDKDVRQEMAGTLAHKHGIKWDKVMPAVLDLLDEHDEDLRLVAARTVTTGAATMIELFKVLPIVLIKLGSPGMDSRVYAAGVLLNLARRAADLVAASGDQAVTTKAWQPFDDAVPTIIPLIDDPSPRVRADVANALATYYRRGKKGKDLVSMLERLDEATLKRVLNGMRYADDDMLPEFRAFLDARQGADLAARFKLAASSGQAELNLSAASLDAVPVHSLPPEVGMATALKRLDLGHNRLTSLPPEIGKLAMLETLILSSNTLDSLPPQIGQLSRLKQLFLYNNRLVHLPPEIGRLARLEYLQLIQNTLETLPGEFGNLQNLACLELERNHLAALPHGFGKLAKLKTLDLRGNALHALPAECASLVSLESLSLCGNPMTEIPPVVFQLPNLNYLYMSGSNVTRIPPEISNLRHLKTLGLRNNKIVDLPPELFDIPGLEYVDLANNQLSTIPHHFSRLKRLRWLELWGNKIALPDGVLRRCNHPQAILQAYFSKMP